MGILDTINSLDLADDVREALLAEARTEQEQRDQERRAAQREARRHQVEQEVQGIQALFGDQPELVGALKYARRVLLSDDEEPGLVLLTDDELNLADDQRTGSRQREEVTAAGVLRQFISLLPKNDQGRISLADVVTNGEVGVEGRPEGGGDPSSEDRSKQARENLGKLTGRPVERTRSRYTTVGGLS